MKVILYGLLISCLIFGCSRTEQSKSKLDVSSLAGKWAFIKFKDPKDYAEIDFNRNNLYIIRSENYFQSGLHPFKIIDDTLILHDNRFLVHSYSESNFELLNSGDTFYLYRIPFNESMLDKNQIDPFYLRKCYFFVHLNMFSMNDAIQYLNNANITSDTLFPKTEYIKLR